ADRNKHGMDRMLVLPQNFHTDCPLPGDDIRVIKRMNKYILMLQLQLRRMSVGVGVTVSPEDDLAAQTAHRIGFEFRRGDGHHNHSLSTQILCAQCYALCMISSRCADYASSKFVCRQPSHFVVGPSQFEAVDRLAVFAFEPDLVA